MNIAAPRAGRHIVVTAGPTHEPIDPVRVIANRSSNVGVPPLARTTFPEGKLAPLSKGRGEDYGLGFDLLDGRLNARVVYFQGSERGRVTAPVAGVLRDTNVRVADALAGVRTAGTSMRAQYCRPWRRPSATRARHWGSSSDSTGTIQTPTPSSTRPCFSRIRPASCGPQARSAPNS